MTDNFAKVFTNGRKEALTGDIVPSERKNFSFTQLFQDLNSIPLEKRQLLNDRNLIEGDPKDL